METFITKIYAKESRGGVRDLEIPLSETHRQHLIITGKNGSGKTGLLENIKNSLSEIIEKGFTINSSCNLFPYFNVNGVITGFDERRHTISKNIQEITNLYLAGEFLLAYFGAKRTTDENFRIPTGINKIELKEIYGLQDSVNKDFIQYFVNMQADRLFAKEEQDTETVKKIDEWFERFENQLKEIFNTQRLKVVFDRLTYNFTIEIDNEEPFDFYRLSDGYSAIISIVTELLLRTESYANKDMWLVNENSQFFLHRDARKVKAYDMEGIVLIDEIETHLHVELQKRVLPFLIAFFPKLQFIVTTHSPFVIQSVSNATICDLEHKIITNDLSAYSYDALVESYFMTDKYSAEVKEKINEYENLLAKKDKTIEDTENIKSLQEYFANAKLLSKELRIKLNQIEFQFIQ